jgi:hypothetical protein
VAPKEKPGDEPGLSSRRIRELASWYIERADQRRNGGAGLDQESLDVELSRVLRDEVLPEFLDVEFERVLDEVFRPQ